MSDGEPVIYLDTSVVVALLTPEDTSETALQWLENTEETLISSDWLITETHSALGIKQRHYGLSPAARQAAANHLERLFVRRDRTALAGSLQVSPGGPAAAEP